MRDPLIDREEGQISGVGESSRAEQRLQAGQHARRAVGRRVAAVDKIRTWQVQARRRNRCALMLEKRRIGAKDTFDCTES